MRICIYAFSTTALFFRALVDLFRAEGDDIEWSVIFPQGNFRRSMMDIIPAEQTCYLYENFRRRYNEVDSRAIQDGMGTGEGLVTALMKDKGGYRFLEKNEQLRRAATMHVIYEQFLRRIKPDYILLPNVEATDGFVLLNICRKLGIEVLYTVSYRMFGGSFFAPDPYETLPSYFGGYTSDDLTAARLAIGRFLGRKSPFVDEEDAHQMPPKPSVLYRAVANFWIWWRYERLHASEETVINRVRRNLRPLAEALRHAWFETMAVRYFDRFTPEHLPSPYIFYALHFTPETSINGLEPYYVDQLRAVDALLLNLPKGMWLVVKEHPSMVGRRPLAFYRTLRRRPGLILLHPCIDSRKLVAGASLVATVTGTVGLESYLLGKPCIMFGPSFFAHLCVRAPALAELRQRMEQSIASYTAPSEAEKEREVAKLLNIGGAFDIWDPYWSPAVLAPNRVRAARDLVARHIARLCEVRRLGLGPKEL